MELNELISLLDKGYICSSIIIPKLDFNGSIIKDIEFIKVGYTYDGKTIYQSKNCLCILEMEKLLEIDGVPQEDKGIGECDICRKAEKSLDDSVFQVLGKHIQPYIRTYDGHTSSEKIFLPLECEVFKKAKYSKDKETFLKYHIWNIFNLDSSYRKKYLIYNGREIIFDWLEANKSKDNDKFCGVFDNGGEGHLFPKNNYGVSIAFCV